MMEVVPGMEVVIGHVREYISVYLNPGSPQQHLLAGNGPEEAVPSGAPVRGTHTASSHLELCNKYEKAVAASVPPSVTVQLW